MTTILTLNAGSSSIKFAVFAAADEPRQEDGGQIENIGGDARLIFEDKDTPAQAISAKDHASAVQALLAALEPRLGARQITGIGHRVVHGGPKFAAPTVVTAEVLMALEGYIPLAPLHQPHNLAALQAAQAAFPGAVQVACFDTSFHAGKPFVNDAYGLPLRFYEAGVRRYGFHGLSYDYIRSALMAEDEARAQGRVIVAHLGNGASLCAMKAGRSVATTMGFSALDGLAMGTRPGQIDAGVLLYLMNEHGMGYAELTQLLYKESGLKGLSGVSNDMRVLMASDTPEAAQAVDYFVARLQREIGSLTAALGGLDTLVFTGGIGENAAAIRARAIARLGYLGLELDAAANDAGQGVITTAPSAVTAMVIPTNEELVIARAVGAAL